MSKQFEFALKLVGKLDSTFKTAFTSANKEVRKVREQTKQLTANNKLLEQSYKQGVINTETYNRAMQQTAQSLAKLKQREHELSSAIREKNKAQSEFYRARRELGSAMVTASIAVAPIAMMTKTAAEFEKGMSKVKAITGATEEEMAKLSETAKELGAKTQFSARESAEAMTYLGMAGWETSKIIKAMPGLLDLAAAGGTSLAETADIVSDQLTAFGLSADQATHMADVFAATVTQTNTDVSRLGETLKYAAPVARAFGVSMEETSAIAGMMANAAIKGSQAGTALRAGFLRLAGSSSKSNKMMQELGLSMSEVTAQQEEASAALADLGIQMSDTSGPRKMSAIIKEIAEKTKDMTNEQRLNTMSTIFGTNAASAWIAVIDQGGDALDKLTDSLENSDGKAAEMAETMQANAAGAMKRLSSAAESVAISLGSTLLPTVSDVGDAMANEVAYVAKLAQEYPKVTETVIKATLAVAGLFVAYKTLKVGYAGVIFAKTALNLLMKRSIVISGLAIAKTAALATATKLVTAAQWAFNVALNMNPIGLVIMAIAALVAAGIWTYKNWEEITAFLSEMWNGPLSGARDFVNNVIDLFAPLFRWIEEKWTAVKNVFTFGGGGGTPQVAHNATGGIYKRGAFLTTFAEQSGESAIPHTPTARNIGLLEKTNEIMGNPLGSGSVSVNFAPTINISGSADVDEVQQVLSDERNALAKMLEDMQQRNRRVSFEN